MGTTYHLVQGADVTDDEECHVNCNVMYLANALLAQQHGILNIEDHIMFCPKVYQYALQPKDWCIVKRNNSTFKE